jgi:hypothetical protein
MSTEEITIELDSDSAQVFKSASTEEQHLAERVRQSRRRFLEGHHEGNRQRGSEQGAEREDCDMRVA